MKARLDALQKIGINVDQWLQRAEEQCGSQESSSMKGEGRGWILHRVVNVVHVVEIIVCVFRSH